MNDLRRFSRQIKLLCQIRKPFRYVVAADNAHWIFDRNLVAVSAQEFAEKLDTLSLTSIFSFFLKPCGSANSQMRTGWERNQHVPLPYHAMALAVHSLELAVSIQQRKDILHDVPFRMATGLIDDIARVCLVTQLSQLSRYSLTFFASY